MSILRAVTSTFAALLLCRALAMQAVAQTAWPVQYLPCAIAAEQRVEEALLRPARLQLANVTPSELADYLSRREGVPVIIDHPAFEDAGLDPEEPLLQARSSRQSLGAALHELLSPLELEATIRSEAILITSQDEADRNRYVRLYPVVDLLMVQADAVAAYLREFSPWLAPTERIELQQFVNSPGAIPNLRIVAQFGRVEVLEEQITTHVEEDSWDYYRGVWSLEYLPGPCVLAVAASYRGHQLLDQYLRRLRQERAADVRGQARRPVRVVSPEEVRDAPSVVVGTAQDPVEEVVSALNGRVQWELQDALLDDLVPQVAGQSGLSVIVDEQACEENGVPRDTPLRNASYRGISLAAALEHTLREIDLAYTLAGSVLVLTSADEADARLHARAYSVGEILPVALQPEWGGWQEVEPPPERLLRREGTYLVAPLGQLRPARVPDADSLIEVVTTVVEPETWDCNGGEGAVEYLPPGRLLVVSQTLAVHRVLEGLLTQLVQYQRLVKGGVP